VESFFSFLERRVQDCSSLLCVGLDPHRADLPEPTVPAARASCLRVIEATAQYAAAFKPNAAFFEAFGPEGWALLREVIQAVEAQSRRLGSHIPVILDAKRGDIAATAEAYAHSAFHDLGADAITLSPYLGRDALEPFLVRREKGAFLLCKTSNPGSDDLQSVLVEGQERLYERVARLAVEWNTRDNLGLVVGATDPAALAAARVAAPGLWFLVPGVGAQGGDLEAALAAGLRPDGMGLLVNVSRAIASAGDPARAAAETRDAIFEAVRTCRASVAPSKRLSRGQADLADALLEAGCVRFGAFTLKSGAQSPIYFDLRLLASHPRLLAKVARAYARLLAGLTFDRVAALPYAALPIGTAIALQTGHPMVYPRREVKEYGTRAVVEGEFRAGDTVVLIDDLATTGGSKFEAIDRLQAAGLVVRDVVVLIDRQAGARRDLEAAGFRLHAIFSMSELLDHWEATGRVEVENLRAARKLVDQGQE
jgi:uridine monophosphate synthetase